MGGAGMQGREGPASGVAVRISQWLVGWLVGWLAIELVYWQLSWSICWCGLQHLPCSHGLQPSPMAGPWVLHSSWVSLFTAPACRLPGQAGARYTI